MPLTSPGNDDDTGENHQPTLRKNTAEPVEQTLKQNIQDLVSIIYSFSARLYGRRRAERAQRIVRLLEEGGSDGEQD